MDAYIISLNNPTSLINKVSEFGLNPILINGVNGKQLTNEEINKNTIFMCSMFCPKSVIGIAMAHIKVWDTFLTTNKKNAIVFEDDVVFTKNFKKQFDIDMENVPSDFDIFYLGCIGCTNKINMYTILGTGSNLINLNSGNVNKYINIPSIVFATHAYVISRKGAKKLLNYLKYKIAYHIDFEIQKLIRDNLINAYGLNKRIVYQTSTDDTVSSNMSSNHPIILTNLLDNYYTDTKVRASYFSNLQIIRIGDINFSPISIIFITSSIFLSASNIEFYQITIGYLLLSLQDIYMNKSNKMLILHYLLLIIPYLLIKYLNLWEKLENNVI
jgi:GR25 family glycosyltransferase involved in LPS biosynthesis